MRVIVMQKVEGIAGSERYLLSILPALARRGVDVSFLMVRGLEENQAHAQFMSELAKAGIRTHVIASRFTISPALIWELRNLIERERADVLHTNLIHSDVYGALAKFVTARDVALVSGKHGYQDAFQAAHGFDAERLRWDGIALATRFAALKADHIFSISEGLARLLIDGALITKEKMKVIPYGFDFDTEPSRGPEGTFRFGRKQIVCVSRLIAVKQLHVLINAMPRLRAKFPDLNLVLVGDGPLRQSLEDLARRNGVIDHVIFEGFRDNVLDYIRDSDIFALPSLAEGFGRVILEAWWNRKPVVCFDVPALNEIVKNNYDGLLVPKCDETAFADALERLLDDTEESARIGTNGRLTYESQYTLSVMVDRTIALYREALEGRKERYSS
jgi:glycosyltransferase involved in cell wall biosynthesis